MEIATNISEECCFSLLTNAPVIADNIVYVSGREYEKRVAWAAYAQQYLGIVLGSHARDITQHILQSTLKQQEHDKTEVQQFMDDPASLFFTFFEKELTDNS